MVSQYPQRRYPALAIGSSNGALVHLYTAFRHGSPRVADYLRRYGSHRTSWDSPKPTAESLEAEWGFEPELRGAVERIAQERGYRMRRIVFDVPEQVNPLVADLYHWWYAQRRITARRLLVEYFLMMEPFWTLRTASIPFWLTFNKEPSADTLEMYLDRTGLMDEIYMMLFSHGVDSVGLVPSSGGVRSWPATENAGHSSGSMRKPILAISPPLSATRQRSREFRSLPNPWLADPRAVGPVPR